MTYATNHFKHQTNTTGMFNTLGRDVYQCTMTNGFYPGLTLITSATTIREKPQTDITGIHKDPIKIYPNPTSGQVNNKAIINVKEGNIVVYTMNGQQLYQQQWDGTTTAIDLSVLNDGVYWLQISTEKFIQNKRIIINK